MAYRKPQRHFSFADLAVETLADKNRALSVLKQLNATIDWKPIEQLLEQFYHTGKRAEGGKAYPPLLLFKCLMLQKWFQIPSDPELESQINDRISFKLSPGMQKCTKNGNEKCTTSRKPVMVNFTFKGGDGHDFMGAIHGHFGITSARVELA